MRGFPILLLQLAVSTTLAAQNPTSKRAAPSAVAQQLLRSEDGWAAALVKRDAGYFRRTLAPGFVYTEDAKLMTRDEVLKDAISTTDTVTAAHNEGMVVHEGAPSTAVVTGLLVIEGRSRGKPFVRRYRFTDTWVKQTEGQWQMIAAQDYLIPK
jgi:ketosteroid isomerase-like protein